MIKEALGKVTLGNSLSEGEMTEVMREIMTGQATPAQIGGLLAALRLKGETVDELTGCARAMREVATPVVTSRTGLLDTCGTGGDGCGTFNISTAAAFVAAGAGLPVAKHGNRAMTSKAGSADVLEALGVQLSMDPRQVGECLDKVGIAFLFAQSLHPAMRHAAGPRKELGMRTIFNLLGPLTNPAGATRQVVGAASADWTEMIAETLLHLGAERAMAVHGMDGVDEISLAAQTKITEVRDGKIMTRYYEPEELGFGRVLSEAMKGGTPAENAEIVRSILGGEKGPRRDVVLVNAAAAIMVGGAARDMAEAAQAAAESINSGKALAKLNELIRFTRECAPEQAKAAAQAGGAS